MWGCYPRKDIDMIIKIKPNNWCIEAIFENTCTWLIWVNIKEKCNNEYYFKDSKNKIHYIKKNARFHYHSIIQEKWNWEINLINKNNNKDTYIIKGENYYIKEKNIILVNLEKFKDNINYKSIYILIYILNIIIFVFLIKKLISKKQ